MKTLIRSLKIAFVIIGAILGAGFVSGKEIYEFFYGQNIYLVSTILFIMFSSVLYFSLRFDLKNECRLFGYTKPLFIIGNFIIASGMLSAVDSLFLLILPASHKFQPFSLITVIFSTFVMFGGKRWLKIVNTILVPAMIFVIVVLVFIPYSDTSGNGFGVNLYKLASYGGLNLFLAMPVMVNLGEGENRKVSLISAIFSAFVVSVLVYMIYSCVCNLKIVSDLPVLQILKENKTAYLVYVFVLFAGILTTLLGAHFAVFNYFDYSKRGILLKVLLTVGMFAFSKIGFQKIISDVYPVMGIVNFAVILIYAFERFFFPKAQRKNTSIPLKNTK